MATPAERRFQRMTAASMGSDSPIAVHRADNLYEQMLMLLTEHRRALKTIQALERKLQAKAKMVPEYEAYLTGVLDSNSGRQDEVLVTLMLWYIDIGNIDKALPLAEYALKHSLVMPDRFDRGLACTIAEEIAETSARLLESETSVSAEMLSRTVALTRDHDMYDEARAKLYKQLGVAQENAGHLTDALASYEAALKLHEKCGVKKYIEKIQRELKKTEPPAPPVPQSSTGQTEPPPVPVTTEQPEKADADAS